ncbi:Lipase [Macleaya cordata]|uniref:Lipase n=1 Tax=Macleaya cordata TaxID=56857 RepID=A0A200PLR0_MACCD|nr:Lipase [Macleaya cordata]
MNTKATIFLTFFFSLSLSLIAATTTTSTSISYNTSLVTHQSHGISAVFAFGDSTLDTGNNDFISTLFQGNHMPYGRDFPGFSASGRFTNGRLIPDFLVEYLRIKDALPPYLYPNLSNEELLTGVGFASAGTGLDNLTASIASVLNMNTQLEYFERYLSQIQSIVGNDRARQVVGDGLFLISAGTNDMVDNFYDLPTRSAQFSLSDYQDFLIGNLESVVQRLYAMGARKFAISGLPPIGCLPVQRTVGNLLNPLQRVCMQQQNIDSQGYNHKLQSRIQRLQSSLRGSTVAYVEVYDPMMDMATNPLKYGFEEATVGCCGTGLLEMGILCSELSLTCPDASRYMFWDAVHPSEATYQNLANIFVQNVLPRFLN